MNESSTVIIRIFPVDGSMYFMKNNKCHSFYAQKSEYFLDRQIRQTDRSLFILQKNPSYRNQTHLPQCNLNSSQVVIIFEVRAGVVNVVEPQLQILYSLKMIIHFKALTEGGVRGIFYPLSSPQLKAKNNSNFV